MKTTIIYFASILMLLFSCKNENSQNEIPETNITTNTEKSELPFEIDEKHSKEEIVHFNGKIVSTKNGLVKLSAPIGGIIESILVQNSEELIKGQSILKIGGNDLIDLQEKFLSSFAQLKYLKANYERISKLYEAKIKTENEYLIAEKNYNTELAIYNANKQKLNIIGLDISKIETGDFFRTYTLKSPKSGIINKMNFHTGQFIKSDTELAEIIDSKEIELLIYVFNKDIGKISIGQKLEFATSNNLNSIHTAIIDRISNEINPRNNTIICYASITNEDIEKVLPNQLVSGKIFLTYE